MTEMLTGLGMIIVSVGVTSVAVGALAHEIHSFRHRRGMEGWRHPAGGGTPMEIRCYVCRQDLWVIADDPLPSIKKHLETEKHKHKVKEKA